MEITIKRTDYTAVSTIGEFWLDGKFFCYCLEDTDRQLFSTDPLTKIQKVKVYGKTAIPKGRYKVVITMSNRFKRLLPLLLNIPGWEGVRIHPGNTAENTEGCLLPGLTRGQNFVGNSRTAFASLYKQIEEGLKQGEVWLTIS